MCILEYKGSDLCLLYSHGNATDMGQMMPYLELLRSSLKVCLFCAVLDGNAAPVFLRNICFGANRLCYLSILLLD